MHATVALFLALFKCTEHQESIQHTKQYICLLSESIQNHRSYFMQETFFSALAQSLLRIPSDNFFLWRHTIDSRLLLSMGGSSWWMERHWWWQGFWFLLNALSKADYYIPAVFGYLFSLHGRHFAFWLYPFEWFFFTFYLLLHLQDDLYFFPLFSFKCVCGRLDSNA